MRPETRAPHRASSWKNWTVDPHLLFSVSKEVLVLSVLLLTCSQEPGVYSLVDAGTETC